MKFFTKRMRSQKGFTLIELIIVIAIIGILAAILLPRFANFTGDANRASAVSLGRNVKVAVDAEIAKGNSPTGNVNSGNVVINNGIVLTLQSGQSVEWNSAGVVTATSNSITVTINADGTVN